ncbi:MAG: hypothetical protein QM796_12780 [Chthoniobacteraceae bacterium]
MNDILIEFTHPAPMPPFNAPETHLFILWQQARDEELRILEDIGTRFEVVAVREVHWSPGRVAENFTRFYGQKLPPGSFKEEHCGSGPFLVVIVRDRHPLYENRPTSKGERLVNASLFDAKQRYRAWTGGGHRIHATDSETETRHNLALLFGVNLAEFTAAHPEPWNGSIESVHADLAGAGGWTSLRQLFSTLNATVNYLVLRNFEWLPDQFATEEHGDIDLLTDSLEDLVFLANGRKVFPGPNRVHYAVPIGGVEVLFDFRHFSDHYYDTTWEKAMLAGRQWHERGFPVLAREDYFYSLLYHAVVHKPGIAPDYVEKLTRLARELRVPHTEQADFSNAAESKRLLDFFLKRKGYFYVRPKDQSVQFHDTLLLAQRPAVVAVEALEALPLLRPLPALLSARKLVEHEGRAYFSSVYDDGKAIIKQTTGDLAWRDAQLLRKLDGPNFPRVLAARQEEGWSWASFERVEGRSLPDVLHKVGRTPEKLAQFFKKGLGILTALKKAGITHRDIHVHNLLLREGRPVLIDFGWAISNELPCFTPRDLGDAGRPPDGSFCDVYAMGQVFAACVPVGSRLFEPLIKVMIDPNPRRRVTSLPVLKQRLKEIPLPEEWPQPPWFETHRREGEAPPWQETVERILAHARQRLSKQDAAGARLVLENGLACQPQSPELRAALEEILKPLRPPMPIARPAPEKASSRWTFASLAHRLAKISRSIFPRSASA